MVASVKELNKRVITSFLLILLLIFTIKVSFFLFIVLFFTFCEIFYEFYYILNKIFKKHKLKLYLNLIFFLFYLTLCILIIWSNLNSKNDLNIIQIFALFSPIFLLYPIAEIEVLGRKEIILFSFYVSMMIFCQKLNM